jgi:hypothetical protein
MEHLVFIVNSYDSVTNVNVRACPSSRTLLRPLGATEDAARQAMTFLSLACELAHVRTYASLLVVRGGVSRQAWSVPPYLGLRVAQRRITYVYTNMNIP